jgi:predicted aldo/keto reductase-like oxidoreductase
MLYRADKKYGNELSALGLGCMRFQRNLARIDMKKAEALVMEAIDLGVNYFDVAYLYPGSEEALGAILSGNGARDRVNVATKLPLAKCASFEDFDNIFRTQMKWLRTDRADYYLMHNLSSTREWDRLRGLGIEKWIESKKASGEIRRAGFSFHGAQDAFMDIVQAYDWDFCQIQYNYMNVNYQAGRAGLKKAAELGLSVIVMEPLLGGILAGGLPRKARRALNEANPDMPLAAWALRWLWDQPEVTVVLSGMNTSEQLRENAAWADFALERPLSEGEMAAIDAALRATGDAYRVPCTGCNYCMPCPRGVNIPGTFAAYNTYHAIGRVTGYQQYMTGVRGPSPGSNRSASLCVDCGKCASHCPQHIEIAKKLREAKGAMEPFWFGAALWVFRKVMGG